MGRHRPVIEPASGAPVAQLHTPVKPPVAPDRPGRSEVWGVRAVVDEGVASQERSASGWQPSTRITPDLPKRDADGSTVPAAYAPPPDSPQLSKLVRRLLAALAGGAPQSLMFVSVDQGAQTAQLCADVAKTLAAAGHGWGLVVDADRNGSALPDQFGVGSRPGLSDVLDGRASIEAALVLVGPNLSLLTSGLLPRPGGFCLLPDRVERLMGDLKKRFDYILVHGMPLDQGSDSLVFGSCAEGALMVVAAHATPRVAARQAKEQLEAAGARLLGVVLTERRFPIPEVIYRRL